MKKSIISLIIVVLLFISINILWGSRPPEQESPLPTYSPTPPPTPEVTVKVIPVYVAEETPPVEETPEQEAPAEIEETAPPSRGKPRYVECIEMVASAYDLSFESCKKKPDHPEYGITYSGKRATENHTVAVDPKVIPLGTEMYIEFPEKYSYLDGVYVAEDIGSAIKGNRIDIFFGESAHDECMEFGLRPVKVYILEDDVNG